MKYINAEKLIAEIERRKRFYERTYERLHQDDPEFSTSYAIASALKELRSFITSLQQEQPMPDSTQLIESWNEAKSVLQEKDFRGDEWRLAYNAFMFGFSKGLNTKREK